MQTIGTDVVLIDDIVLLSLVLFSSVIFDIIVIFSAAAAALSVVDTSVSKYMSLFLLLSLLLKLVLVLLMSLLLVLLLVFVVLPMFCGVVVTTVLLLSSLFSWVIGIFLLLVCYSYLRFFNHLIDYHESILPV